MTDGTKIKDLTEKSTGVAADEFVINDAGADKKLGMDGIRITSSQVTDITGFTLGSIPFSDGTSLIEDNSNLFWDDSNNRLGLGITSPLDVLHVVGDIELDHTAVGTDEHALDIEADAAGFGDIKALDVDYVTGAISTGEDEGVLLVNIIENASLGGEIFALEVLTTTVGSTDTIVAVKTGIGIDPINQFSGTFGNAEVILNKTDNVLVALSTGGAGNITVFVDDDDTITIGDANKFEEIEFIVDTGASGAGIKPTFEFSTGTDTWDTFTPTDGTNGFKNTGEVLFDDSDIPGWMTGTGTKFLIRITRTRNELTTKPILDLIQISAVTVFKWDSLGVINALDIETATVSASDGSLALTLADSTGIITTQANIQFIDSNVSIGKTGTNDLTITADGVAAFNVRGALTTATGILQSTKSTGHSIIYGTNSETGATNNRLFDFNFRGSNSVGTVETFGGFQGKTGDDIVSATRNGKMFIFVLEGGSNTNYISLIADTPTVNLLQDTALTATKKFFLDGSGTVGGNTSIREATADIITFEQGGNDISFPAVSGADTIPLLGVAATWTSIQTHSASVIMGGNALQFLTGQTIIGDAGGLTYEVPTGDIHDFTINGITALSFTESTANFNSHTLSGFSSLLSDRIGITLIPTASGWIYNVDDTDAHDFNVNTNSIFKIESTALTLADSVNFVFNTSTGTKIGTGTTQKIGFWDAPPIVQPTVTGERDANPGLASLLTQLDAEGLIVDSTTAGSSVGTPEHVTILADSVSVVWSNQPAALTEFKGNTECRVKVDATNHTQCRLVVNVVGAGLASSSMHAEYDAGSGFLELADTANAMDVAIDSVALVDSGFVNIDALAKADVTIRIVGEGGDAMADPDFTMIHLEFK